MWCPARAALDTCQYPGHILSAMRARSGKSPTTPRRPRRPSGRTPVERLRAICLALPETTEKLAWGEPTWRVRGRLFAQLDDHHHGTDHLAVWLPAPLGEQEAMMI